jgi:hypothetical protein
MLSLMIRLSGWVLLIGSMSYTATQAVALDVEVLWASKGDPSGILFGRVSGLLELPDGSVAVADAQHSAIYRLKPRDNAVTTLARTGAGPGEVRTPTLMAPGRENHHYVLDVGHQAVLVYDADFRPVRRIQLEGMITNPKGFAVLADGSLLLGGGVFSRPEGFHLFAGDGRYIRSWRENPPTRDPTARLQTAGGPLLVTGPGEFFWSNSSPHEVARVDLRTSRVEVLAADARLLPPIGDDFLHRRTIAGRTMLVPQWWYAQSRGLYVMADGTLLNVITRVYEEDSIWQVLARDGRELARHQVRRAYHPYSMARDGNVLATFKDPETDEDVVVMLRVTRRRS